jgi:alpha-beta hydrolase superfamily lysophospholipase
MLWLLLVLLALLILLGWLFRPIPTDALVSHPQPAADYQEALDRLQAWSESERAGAPLLDVCRSKVMAHGQATEHAIVFFHGYTNCPEQFAQLGQRFYALGYNVFIPCMPCHGYQDQLTKAIINLTAEDLVAYGDQAVDVARGLGRQVTVMGISGGGALAAWLVQNRADVDYAVPLAASIWVNVLPVWLSAPVIRIFMASKRMIWWDPRTKQESPFSAYYAYPKYALRSLGHMLRLGTAVREQARLAAPAGGSVLMMINDADPGVSNVELNRLAETWSRHEGARVQTYHFERSRKMPHDIITPGTPGVPTGEVYDRIVIQITDLHRSPPMAAPEETDV